MIFPKRSELNHLFESESNSINYLIENRCLNYRDTCEHCGGQVFFKSKLFRCKKDGCRKSWSIFKNSFFSKTKLNTNTILELGYYWLCECSYSSVIKIMGLSSKTICAYYKYFRQLVASSLDQNDDIIGGDGIIVEVDESKFGRRKYHRGHRIEGAWVIGGIERTPNKKFFVEVIEQRNAETIQEVLRRHINQGSILYTDCWRGYHEISQELQISHLTVNHSVGFINNENGCHTNTIEAKWGTLKRKIHLRGRVQQNLDSFLLERIWRKKFDNNLWIAFIEAIREVHYD